MRALFLSFYIVCVCYMIHCSNTSFAFDFLQDFLCSFFFAVHHQLTHSRHCLRCILRFNESSGDFLVRKKEEEKGKSIKCMVAHSKSERAARVFVWHGLGCCSTVKFDFLWRARAPTTHRFEEARDIPCISRFDTMSKLWQLSLFCFLFNFFFF